MIPEKSVRNRDLEISKNPNIDEVDRIYMTSPRGLIGRKTEPPDYVLMFSSANVPGITYKLIWGFFVLHFRKTDLRVPLRKPGSLLGPGLLNPMGPGP